MSVISLFYQGSLSTLSLWAHERRFDSRRLTWNLKAMEEVLGSPSVGWVVKSVNISTAAMSWRSEPPLWGLSKGEVQDGRLWERNHWCLLVLTGEKWWALKPMYLFIYGAKSLTVERGRIGQSTNTASTFARKGQKIRRRPFIRVQRKGTSFVRQNIF